jgi:bifunctional DNase/RNase
LPEDELLKVKYVQPFYRLLRDVNSGAGAYVVGLSLLLENNEEFTMVNIPMDVAEAIKLINDSDMPPRRQSIYTFLSSHEDFKEILRKTLKRVVIDELEADTGVYTATVEFEDGGVSISVKMIPSHAIYLALISGKPIFVSKKLVDMEKWWGNESSEGEEGDQP